MQHDSRSSLSKPELIKKDVFDILEYVPVKSIEEIAAAYELDPASIIKLDSNENPLRACLKIQPDLTIGIGLHI